MKNSLLVVYNTCGLSGKENSEWYIKSVRSILAQDHENFHVVISSCCNTQLTRQRLEEEFGDEVSYCYLDAVVPVNISSNFAVIETVKAMGEFSGYVYVDSGMNFENQTGVLSKAHQELIENDYGLLSIQASNDNGFKAWLGFDGPIVDQNFVIPPGRACNSHIHLFPNEFYKAYNGRLQPDIFVAYCTESTFSFFAAGIGKRWAILKDVIVHHDRGVDGATSGFDHTGPRRNPANNLLCGLDMDDILRRPDAWTSGFGYEEISGVFVHNPDMYDDLGNHKNPELLRKFLNDTMFLRTEVFSYSQFDTSRFVRGRIV